MTLLSNLIHIPERVHQGDFVLQLSKGVTEPEQTLRDYEAHHQSASDLAPRLSRSSTGTRSAGRSRRFTRY